MNEMYLRIESLCKDRGINITQMCREAGVPRGNLTELKMNRTTALSTKTLGKIANYFNVSMEVLLGGTETKNAPAESRCVTKEDIKFALFKGDGEVTDSMLDEVLAFAQFVQQRERNKK